MKLDLELIDIPADRIREDPEEKLDTLVGSLMKLGQLQAILVRPQGNGRFWVVDGVRRTLAHRLLAEIDTSKNTIEATLSPDAADEEWLLLAELAANTERLELTPHEVGQSAKRLLTGAQQRAKERKDRHSGQVTRSRAMDEVAQALGGRYGRTTLERIIEIQEQAEADPEGYGDLALQLQETKRPIEPLYNELKRREYEASAPLPEHNTEAVVEPEPKVWLPREVMNVVYNMLADVNADTRWSSRHFFLEGENAWLTVELHLTTN